MPLFGISEEFTLPDFLNGNVISEYSPPILEGARADIFAETGNTKWVIEVKSYLTNRAFLWALSQVAINCTVLSARGWLVIFSDVPDQFKQMATDQGILITGDSEWEMLKHEIEVSSI